MGIVIPTRTIGRATLYKIDLENPMVKMLNEHINKLSLEIAEKELMHAEKPVPARSR